MNSPSIGCRTTGRSGLASSLLIGQSNVGPQRAGRVRGGFPRSRGARVEVRPLARSFSMRKEEVRRLREWTLGIAGMMRMR